ncbi:MAG: hypothetical protein ABR595_03190 [Psychroflexus sp.]
MLEVQSTTKGMLMPRLTSAERDAIVEPVEGLQIYNTTNNTLDVYSNGAWKSFAYSKESNLVYVYSLDDLPTPNSGEITLDTNKMYVFSGSVNISPNYLNVNGAGLRGTFPEKDQVISNVDGAVLRSTDKNVYITDLAVVPASSNTKAYNFTDDGTHYCNIFEGSSVVDAPGTPSLGVGEISGFIAISIYKNLWDTADGLKVGGTLGKLAASNIFIINITNGAGIEILPNAVVDDIDIKGNYFIYTGQTGIKVDPSANVDRGILTSNLFRDVTTPLGGIDSYSKGWEMAQNSGGIPDSKAFSSIFYLNNDIATTLTPSGSIYSKIEGETTTVDEERFTATNNRITYNGVRSIDAKISASISATADTDNNQTSRYAIRIVKNGGTANEVQTLPISSLAAVPDGQTFQITLNSLVDMVEGDFVEVWLLATNDSSVTVVDLQFRVND